MMNYFNTNLRFLRKLLAVSQEQLALQAKVRSTTISNYENGISKPGLEEVIEICHFFGVPIDIFVLQNLEESKVITDEMISEFKQNGKLFGKESGKVLAKISTTFPPQKAGISTTKEADESLAWAVMKVLREMDGKLDLVRSDVQDLKKTK